MKPLYKVLNKSNIINEVLTTNITDAIIKVYKDDKYKFVQNSELIDVKKRFRIFKYQNQNYIVKTMSKTNGNSEFNNSLKCAKKLNGLQINKYTIEVVVPKLFIINNKYYVVTEYKGHTLQELLYSNEKNNIFKLTDLELLMKTFLDLGIEHMGLCPRNVVINKNKIYLFDFESARFFSKKKSINLRYKTNMLINWTYFFEKSDLENILFLLENNIVKNEPQLNKYEYNYKQLINFNGNNYELRKNIMEVVLIAEEKISRDNTDFCLLPIDMASIISDLFDFSTDAIMDMVFYAIRKNPTTKKVYNDILNRFSNIVIETYKNGTMIQPYVLPVMLFAIDLIDNHHNINNIFDEIYGNKRVLLKSYFNNDKEEFKRILSQKLNVVFKKVYLNYKHTTVDIDNLGEHFISFSSGFDKANIQC